MKEVRPHFDPRRGPIRRLERRISNLLVQRLYPRIGAIRNLYGHQLERDLTLALVEVPIRNLPPSFAGISILLVTDLHTGPFVRPDLLERSLARLMGAARPDLLLYGGDLVTYEPEDLDPGRIARFKAPLGSFAVLGNHDYYSRKPHEVVRRLREAGVRLLDNESVELRLGGERIHLAGIDDLHQGRPDLGKALDGTSAPTILLSHNPDVFPEAALERVSLTLSGHTHGGQIRIPGLSVLARQSIYRLDEGVYRSGESILIVCRGLGVTGLPLRLACPPEAVHIRLRRA